MEKAIKIIIILIPKLYLLGIRYNKKGINIISVAAYKSEILPEKTGLSDNNTNTQVDII